MAEIMSLEPAFGRHEGFYPKINHLKKLVDQIENNPKLFQLEDAAYMLGISRSCLKPLKFWGKAFNLIKEDSCGVFVEHFGQTNFSDDGVDPYLESLTSVSLLHTNLFKGECLVPSWYFFFNGFKQVEFTRDELIHALKIFTDDYFPGIKLPHNALSKDAECIIKMYSENLPENPFFRMGIIVDMGGYYRIDKGEIW